MIRTFFLLFAPLLLIAAEPKENAAVLYYEAVQNTPPFTAEENELIQNAVSNWSKTRGSFSHDEARALLQRYEIPLADFAEASRLPLDWAPLHPHGIRGPFDRQDKFVQLLQLALLRARIQVADKEFTGALESYRQALALVDASTPPSPNENDLMMRTIVQDRLIRVLAADLPRLDEPSLRLLAEQLDFPSSHALRLAAITTQQAYWTHQIDLLVRSDSLTTPFADGFFYGLVEGARRIPRYWRTRGTISQVRTYLKDFQHLSHLLSLPAPERNEQLRDRLILLRPDPSTGSIPLSQPDLATLYFLSKSLDRDVGFQMIRAAIAIYLEGEEALPRFIDPSNDQPFRYEKTSTGFRLHSEFMGVDPISLTFEP